MLKAILYATLSSPPLVHHPKYATYHSAGCNKNAASYIFCSSLSNCLLIAMCYIQQTSSVIWPPCCVMKFITCCCSVCRNASRNLTHWSSVVRSSSKASLRSYAALSPERILLYCLRVSTCSLSSSSRSPKSGSMMSASLSFSVVINGKISGSASVHITAHYVWCSNWWMPWQCYSCVNCMSR